MCPTVEWLWHNTVMIFDRRTNEVFTVKPPITTLGAYFFNLPLGEGELLDYWRARDYSGRALIFQQLNRAATLGTAQIYVQSSSGSKLPILAFISCNTYVLYTGVCTFLA